MLEDHTEGHKEIWESRHSRALIRRWAILPLEIILYRDAFQATNSYGDIHPGLSVSDVIDH